MCIPTAIQNNLTANQWKRKQTDDGYAKTNRRPPTIQISSQTGCYLGPKNYWLGDSMTPSFSIPAAYRPSLRLAVVVQLVAFLLSLFVDGEGIFLAICVTAWAAFWAGTLTLMRRRQVPSRVQLVCLRYGPLAIPAIIFTMGQYV